MLQDKSNTLAIERKKDLDSHCSCGSVNYWKYKLRKDWLCERCHPVPGSPHPKILKLDYLVKGKGRLARA